MKNNNYEFINFQLNISFAAKRTLATVQVRAVVCVWLWQQAKIKCLHVIFEMTQIFSAFSVINGRR